MADEAGHLRRLQLGLADHDFHRIDHPAVLVHPQPRAGGIDEDVAALRHRRDRANAREVGPDLPALALREARVLHRHAQRRVERVHPAHFGDVMLERRSAPAAASSAARGGRDDRGERRAFVDHLLRVGAAHRAARKRRKPRDSSVSALAMSSSSPRRARSTVLASRSKRELLRVDPVELRGAQVMHQHRGRARRTAELVEPQRPEMRARRRTRASPCPLFRRSRAAGTSAGRRFPPTARRIAPVRVCGQRRQQRRCPRTFSWIRSSGACAPWLVAVMLRSMILR